MTADFNLLTSEVTLTLNSPTAVVVVEILEEVQGGDEPRESFELRLVDGLDIAPNNVFLRSSVVTILDNGGCTREREREGEKERESTSQAHAPRPLLIQWSTLDLLKPRTQQWRVKTLK